MSDGIPWKECVGGHDNFLASTKMSDTQKPETIALPIVQDTKPEFEHPRGQEWCKGQTADGRICWS